MLEVVSEGRWRLLDLILLNLLVSGEVPHGITEAQIPRIMDGFHSVLVLLSVKVLPAGNLPTQVLK
jgi:hypothetical protein